MTFANIRGDINDFTRFIEINASKFSSLFPIIKGYRKQRTSVCYYFLFMQ
jgi:hypothetical protein